MQKNVSHIVEKGPLTKQQPYFQMFLLCGRLLVQSRQHLRCDGAALVEDHFAAAVEDDGLRTRSQISSSSFSTAKGMTQSLPNSSRYSWGSSATMSECKASMAMSPSWALYSSLKCGSSFTQGPQ